MYACVLVYLLTSYLSLLDSPPITLYSTSRLHPLITYFLPANFRHCESWQRAAHYAAYFEALFCICPYRPTKLHYENQSRWVAVLLVFQATPRRGQWLEIHRYYSSHRDKDLHEKSLLLIPCIRRGILGCPVIHCKPRLRKSREGSV